MRVMNASNGISLESSLLGFCAFNKNVLYYKDHGVVIRNDEDFRGDSRSVILISGGGSGHEPGQGGYVGKGMLSAAVCGNVFTSPSVTSCLAAILLANDPQREVLVTILNYTGDRLNFGLAVEMAQNVHNFQNVKMLIVDDDCSIDNPGKSTGRRGLAGAVLINKIAGAMSAAGLSLNEIHDFCSSLLCNRLIRTIGFSFHHELTSNELSNIEIGYGIHGEPGSMKIEREKNFKPIISVMQEKLRLSDVNSDVVILFNNLGGASEFVFWQFIQEFIEDLSVRVVKVYAGKFLTSLSKEALSVTVLEVKDSRVLEFLEWKVDVGAGHLFNVPLEMGSSRVGKFDIPLEPQKSATKPSTTDADISNTEKIIEKICSTLCALKEHLNALDSELGDGDTGSTIARAAEALITELKAHKLNLHNPHDMLLQISNILMKSMGGTSGAIFSIFFQCASKAFSCENRHSTASWMSGIALGIEGITRHGKSSIGDRTLLDSLHCGFEAMRNRSSETKDTSAVLEAFASGCRKGAEDTKSMKPKSGRSSYSLSDKPADYVFESRHPDPGAHVVAVIASIVSGTLKFP